MPAAEVDSGISGSFPGLSCCAVVVEASGFLVGRKVYNFVPVVGISHSLDMLA